VLICRSDRGIEAGARLTLVLAAGSIPGVGLSFGLVDGRGPIAGAGVQKLGELSHGAAAAEASCLASWGKTRLYESPAKTIFRKGRKTSHEKNVCLPSH
jgi:hypothetical protein